MANFRRGTEAASEAARRVNFAKTEFFGLKDGEIAVVRFVTGAHELITVNQHNNIPTRGMPPDYEGDKWPTRMSAICRKDPAFAGIYSECFIEEHMKDAKGKPLTASPRQWALACMREEVIGDGTEAFGGPSKKGRPVGYKDRLREVAEVDAEGKPTGKTTFEKDIVIVNMGFKNFFTRIDGIFSLTGSITDRDIWIKRKGSDENTDYQINGLDPIDANVVDADGNIVGKERLRGPHPDIFNSAGVLIFPADPGHPNWAERYHTDIDLGKVIEERASDAFYARFFDTRKPFPPMKKSGDGNGSDASTAQVPKPNTDVDQASLQGIRDRVMGYKKGDGESGSAPTEAPVETPAAETVSAGVQDFG